MKNTLKSFAVVIVSGFLLMVPAKAQALAVGLAITYDTLISGRAVISGDFDDTFLDPSVNEILINAVGSHWRYDARLFRFRDPAIENFPNYSIFIQGRHISNPPPHSGEVSPGLLLGGGGELSYTSLVTQGIFDTRSHHLAHPGGDGDEDFIFAKIDDLNGANDPGFLSFDKQVSLTIDTFHTPEPLSLAMVATGMVGLVGFRRKRDVREGMSNAK